jgi:seryl-tRNA synthetase
VTSDYIISHDRSVSRATMTLDVLHFIEGKGGNPAEIRESQAKRGDPVELVDEIIQMYAEWVKSEHSS